MNRTRILNAAMLAAAAATISACGGGGGDTTPVAVTTPLSVSVDFAAALGTSALASPCSAPLTGLGSGAAKANLQDLRFYISNLRMITASGGEVKVQLASNSNQLTKGSDTVALVDLRDTTAKGNCQAGNGHVSITGTVAAGNYTAIGFTLGVPESLNHVDPMDPANAPLDNTDLGWDWTGGKKHLQVEVNPENAASPGTYTSGVVKTAGGAANTFVMHLGNTGCSKSAAGVYQCTNINTREVKFPTFDIKTQRVAVDLKALFASSNLQLDRGGPVGCMSDSADLECQDIWPVLGATFDATGANVIPTTSAFLRGETVFKAIAK